MKTIIYSIIVIFVSGLFAICLANTGDTKKVILIQTADSKATSVMLTTSANIISGRLKDFYPDKAGVKVISAKNQIQITLSDCPETKTIENLVTQKGSVAFCETYNKQQLTELINVEKLVSMLKTDDNSGSIAEVGRASIADTCNINHYLNTLGPDRKFRFAWSQYPDNNDICLYALSSGTEKGEVLTGQDIESARFNSGKTPENSELEIRFKPSSASSWADMTRRNLNHAIAIVMDNHVLSAPVVNSVINEGRCTITGHFIHIQSGYMAAMLNNGELPLEFNVVN
jgi:preprotein translocase subunit SecD